MILLQKVQFLNASLKCCLNRLLVNTSLLSILHEKYDNFFNENHEKEIPQGWNFFWDRQGVITIEEKREG